MLGNAAGWGGDLSIGHDVMQDAIDGEAARRVLAKLGGGETVAVLAKAEAAPSGAIRGRRHTMLDDSDIHSTRHARALVGGVLAGVIGDTMLYVSGGAEHQGPAGGGPVAIIAKIQGIPAERGVTTGIVGERSTALRWVSLFQKECPILPSPFFTVFDGFRPFIRTRHHGESR